MASVLRNASFPLGRGLVRFNNSSRPFLSSIKIRKSQSAGLVLKAHREFDYEIPFPYKETDYSMLASFFDGTTWRFNENSKIIVVDGPPACGKTKLAKEIADAYDLLYIPHAHLDAHYLNDYGYDMRQLNDQLPSKCKSFDIHEFLQNPKDERACTMQYRLYLIRLGQYIDALNHLLNTGQGVVLDRSFYSDSVFVDTYVKFGFFPQTFKSYVNTVNEALLPDLMKPHLLIYLDTPVDHVLQRIKERNYHGEKASPVYKPEVLKYMEGAYKRHLQTLEKNCELLVYDWSVERNSEIVIEDMEEVNLDDYPRCDPKMEDWRKEAEYEWTAARQFYLQKKEEHFIQIATNIPCLYCKELIIDAEDMMTYETVCENAPGMKYATGYNMDMGDPNPIFKIS